MISTRKTRQILVTGLLAGAAFAASAQTAPTAPAGAPTTAGAPGTERAERGDPAKRFEQMQQRRAHRMAALKDKLQLDAAQEPAWNSFVAAQQPGARPLQRPSREDIAKLTTPQRLDLMQQRQSERSAAFSKRADATRSFYAALKPEQQKTFDAETLRRGHGPRGDHHRGPHHGQPQAPAKG